MFLEVFQHVVDGFGGLCELRQPLQQSLEAEVLPAPPRRAASRQAHLAEERLQRFQADVVVPVHDGKERQQRLAQVPEVPAEPLGGEAAGGHVASLRPGGGAYALPLEVGQRAVPARQVEHEEVAVEGEHGAAPAVGQPGDLAVGLGEALHEGHAEPAQRLHEGLAGQQRRQAAAGAAGQRVRGPQLLGGAAPQRGQLPVLGAAPAVQHHEGRDAAGPQDAEEVAHGRREGAVVAAASEVGVGGEAEAVVEAAAVDDQLGVPHPQLGEEHPALLHEAREALDAHGAGSSGSSDTRSPPIPDPLPLAPPARRRSDASAPSPGDEAASGAVRAGAPPAPAGPSQPRGHRASPGDTGPTQGTPGQPWGTPGQPETPQPHRRRGRWSGGDVGHRRLPGVPAVPEG